jgi:hypothetical protein
MFSIYDSGRESAMGITPAAASATWAAAVVGIMLKGPIEQRDELAQGALVRLLQDWETEP